MDLIKNLGVIAFELSNICPLKDVHLKCPIRFLNTKNKIMPLDTIFSTLEKLKKHEPNPIIFFHVYNEPSIDCRLLYIVHYIRKHMNIDWRISIHTNGYSFDENVLSEFAAEGIDEIVATLRSNEEFIFWTNIKNKIQDNNDKIGIKLITQFFDLRLKLYGDDNGNYDNNIISMKKWKEIHGEEFYCPFIKDWMGIDPDGNVMLCEYDWKRTKKFGNIITDDVEDIFHKKYKYYESVNSNKEGHIPCNVCSFCRNKVSYRLKDFKVMSALKSYGNGGN